MLFNIPQFIDIEDKIVGPLTAKQLGWMGAAGVILLFCWSLLDTAAFAISVLIVGPIFGALAFYRPNNQPLIYFVFSAILFVVRPKIYIWKRIPDKSVLKPISTKKTDTKKSVKMKTLAPKEVSSQKIADISKILDKQ